MSNRKDQPPQSGGYDVGYGKPPPQNRFKPGQSGNPVGRPTGSRNRAKLPARHHERLKEIIFEEDYKDTWTKELERRKAHGISAPDPIPHPDDIQIDYNAGTVRMTGPINKEDKVRWDRLREAKKAAEEEITALNELLAANPDDAARELLLADLEAEIKIKEMISWVFMSDNERKMHARKQKLRRLQQALGRTGDHKPTAPDG